MGETFVSKPNSFSSLYQRIVSLNLLDTQVNLPVIFGQRERDRERVCPTPSHLKCGWYDNTCLWLLPCSL